MNEDVTWQLSRVLLYLRHVGSELLQMSERRATLFALDYYRCFDFVN